MACPSVPILKAAFGRKYSLNAWVDLGRKVHRPRKRFEAGLDNMMRIFTAYDIDVQIHAQLIGKRSVKFVRQVGIEIANPAWANFHVVRKIRPAAEIDDDFSECFIQRATRLSEAPDAMFIAERVLESLT